MKRALICGISGQDGSYLADFLLSKGYEVYGTSRDAQINPFSGLQRLGIKEKVSLLSMTQTDFRSVLQTIKNTNPAEVYNLAGQTSVGLSFEQPVETFETVTVGTINLLEAIRFLNPAIKFYNASSSECFGNTDEPATEDTPFRPRSPYAAAKAAAHWIVANYREAYNMYACSGILFNHESPIRPERFVSQKIISAAVRIGNGSKETLKLGNLDVVRDWGYAKEYVQAIHSMLHQPLPDDFVIATGTSNSLRDMVNEAFDYYGLKWEEHCRIDETLKRPSDISKSLGNAAKAKKVLHWQAETLMPDVVKLMIKDCEQRMFKGKTRQDAGA
ncbi:MAG: GDP-mannose 4,6-dehydratase [Bacteroidia bacterium]|nr:GDP-mannose 4,6-dehydratase [Bacteroidia bacterium]